MKSSNTEINSEAFRDEISLKELVLKAKDWLEYLQSQWLIITLFCVVGGGLGYAYAYLTKPTYTATTTFVLEDGEKASGLSGLGGLASIAGLDIGGSGGGIFQGDNIIELYKSRMMIQKTLLSQVNIANKNRLLIDYFIQFNNLKSKWKNTNWSTISFSDHNTSSTKDSILREVVKDIRKNYLTVAKPDKKLSKIQVDIRSEDEIFAKIFCEQLVDAVNNFYIQTKTKRSSNNVAVLQHKTDSVRNVMNREIYTSVAVGDATPNLNPTRQVQRVAPVQKAQFSAETNKAVLGEMVKNLELTKISLLKETPLVQIIDQPILPLEKERIGRIRSFLIGCSLFGILSILFLSARRSLKLLLN